MQPKNSGMNPGQVEQYLRTVLQEAVRVQALTPLGAPHGGSDLKGYGYGTPILVDYERPDGEWRKAVLHTMSPNPFGHEHMADRAQVLLWQNSAFNQLPRHVRALDVGGIDAKGNLLSLGNVEEFCLLTDYAAGQPYACDLERIRQQGPADGADFARADALCDYLAEIHRLPINLPDLYIRRIRELVGHGECVMGLTDSWASHPATTPQILAEIEHLAVRWRWRLRNRTHRLRAVHGDFHPWNILFQEGNEFCLLDRSRGEYGDPADDVTCLTANYIFFSLQHSGRLGGPFEQLFLRFWDRYLEKTSDTELLDVAGPWFAFRGLVMASPVWYPNLRETVRQQLMAFVLSVLGESTFNPRKVNTYCGL